MADPIPAERERAVLAEVIEHLAPIERRAGSPGEHAAAEWIAARLERAGCAAAVEEEEFRDGYAPLIAGLSAAGLVSGVAALASERARRPAAAVGGAAAMAIADDISNGPRFARRAVQRPKTTWNVVGVTGDHAAARTLVVLAHHDAAPTGRAFDQRGQQAFSERFPGILERMDTSLPLWQAVVAAPTLVALGALRRDRRLVSAGSALAALATAAFTDIARSPVVPGANDNLSAVAALVALAERVRARPLAGLRLLLVSCGAEEVVQGGIYGFAARHFGQLDRDATWVLNLETLGSPRLALLEGEGPLVMEDYVDRRFRDLVARTAADLRVPLRRGMRARNSTDAVIASRAGYPTTTLVSLDRHKALSNYHQMTDTPENLDYTTVSAAVTLTEAVAHELAAW